MTKFRDVSYGLQKLRDFLLGRKHILHARFLPNIAPRTIPTADLPRGPDTPYSQNYYCRRNVFHSVHPPVVAPIAEGPPLIQDPTQKVKVGGVRADALLFDFAPTPGTPWWWDGHFYYELVPDPPASPPPKASQPDPCAPKK
ncbi:unnamed protein product [Danaus chrysippus]|uniref:NADH dehydrogenase [ubiquinone] 1 alpha subcomplex subunit 7 n=1 Tax=Danaus chrysippus TaxID=151541 RepID=A0A8J2W1G7_9NEOP|nr:unnamed protein product [Danaus chrysippus]